MAAARTAGLFPLALALAGCDAQPAAGPRAAATAPAPPKPGTDPHTPAPRNQAAKPDPARLGYDPATRTLTLYPLADKDGRWRLAVPGGPPEGAPVDLEHRFPPDADLDLDAVQVFIAASNRRLSARVSLREIVEVGAARAGR